MKKKFWLKKLFVLFIIIQIVMLTGCGGGGGSSSNNGGGNNSGSIQDNSVVQTAAVASIITNIKNNILGKLFASVRLNAKEGLRISLDDYTSGKKIMALSGLDETKINDGYINSNPDSIASFRARNSENITHEESNIIIASIEGYNVGLTTESIGGITETTYFISENSSNEMIGVSYLFDGHNYATFAYKVVKDGSNISVTGQLVKFDQYDWSFDHALVPNFSLAEISGDNNGFAYIKINSDGTQGEVTEYDYSGKETEDSGDDDPSDLSYLEKFPETISVRFCIKPIMENINASVPNSSARASVEVPAALSDYDTMAKVKALISANTVEEFNSNENIADKNKFLDNQSISGDKVVTSGTINMIVGRHTESGLNVGLIVENANLTIQNQEMHSEVKVWFVADSTSKVVVAFGYSNGGSAQTKATVIFRMNGTTREVEGKTFWNKNTDSLFENYAYSTVENRNADFTGDAEKVTYTLYNSQNRTQKEGYATVKYDGTCIEKKIYNN